MSEQNDESKRRRVKGWLKKNFFRERGFGIVKPDDGGPDIFLHISGFGDAITEGEIYSMTYRRRLIFNLAVDKRSGRVVAVDVQAPRGEMITTRGTVI